MILAGALAVFTHFAMANDHFNAITDDQFIYSYEEMLNFDVKAYLQENAPHLVDQTEVINHWAGTSTVSPKVLLTLIEMKTGLLSHNRSVDMVAPLSDLSQKNGFSEQVEDIATRLATAYYQQSLGSV